MGLNDFLLLKKNSGGHWLEDILATAAEHILATDEEGAPILLSNEEVKALLAIETGDIPGLDDALAEIADKADKTQAGAYDLTTGVKIWNPDQAIFQSITISGAAGEEILHIG